MLLFHGIDRWAKWPIDIVVGYHHVKKRKPDSEGLLLAMSQAGADPGTTFHVSIDWSRSQLSP